MSAGKLIERIEYDTIYHEHFSYFLVRTLADVLGAAGLALVGVNELSSPRRLDPRVFHLRRDRNGGVADRRGRRRARGDSRSSRCSAVRPLRRGRPSPSALCWKCSASCVERAST